MTLEEAKEYRNAERFPAVSLNDEILDWLIAEVERLELELAEANEEIMHLNQMSFGL